MQDTPAIYSERDYKASGLGGCFVGDTPIWTPDGFRPIRDIQVGDHVYCFDWHHKIYVRTVTTTSFHQQYEVRRYHFWGGSFVATPNHAFYTERNTFREIEQWQIDDLLLTKDWDYLPLLGSEPAGVADVYNFTVDEFHCYFVTEAAIGCSNGGGGKSGSKPTENDDDARSTARAFVTEILSEGPIEGLVGGLKGIYLDKTPVQNEDNTYNFKGFTYTARNGNPNQGLLSSDPSLNEVASETGVGVDVTKDGGAITRSFINPELDKIRVRLGIQLQEYKENGDIAGYDLEFNIYIKQGQGAFQKVLNRYIDNKFSSLTEFEYEFAVNNQGGTIDTWAVRVERESKDEESQKIQSVFKWQSYTEVISNKLNYPYTAMVALQFQGEQFDSVPSRSYRVRGIQCLVPSNAVVDDDGGLTFSGVWDGTFYRATKACSDPAWQVFELLTNKRFGLGKKLNPRQIYTADLYEISRYNNQMVPDGLGGTERRYAVNTLLQSRQPALEVIDALLSACHSKRYWAGGTLRFWQDSPRDVSQQFTQADVVDGEFVYSSTAVRSRYTQAIVTWNDPDNFYEQTVEPVEDIEGVDRYGIQETQLTAFGCDSRGRAIRFGRWALFSSKTEVETVTFTARSYGVYVRPGEIIQVHDPRRSGRRWGGLIRAVDSTEGGSTIIYLDQAVEIFGNLRQITCYLPDGTLQTRNLFTGDAVTDAVISQPFDPLPLPESPWIIRSTRLAPSLWRVLSLRLTSDPTKVEITAISYNPAKYTAIEQDLEVPRQTPTYVTPSRTAAPTGVRGEYRIGDEVVLTAFWNAPTDPSITAHFVEWSDDGATWQDTKTVPLGTYSASFTVPASSDALAVRVAAVNFAGRASGWVRSALIGAPVNAAALNLTSRYSMIFN